MFYLTGIVVTFFLAMILISKKGRTEADNILALWLLAAGLHLTLFYLFITGQSSSFPYLLGLERPFPFLHGPFLYLYTQAVTGQITARRFRILHFLPFILAYAFLLPFLLSPAEHKIWVYANRGRGYETVGTALIVAIIMSGIVYIALSLRLLARHVKSIRNQFSNADKINLAWLRYLIYGISVIWITVFFRNDTVVFSTVVIFVVTLGYFGIKQVGIFTQQVQADSADETSPLPPESSKEEPRKTKYQKSGLEPMAAENIHQALSHVMREKKLYTNPELTLAELAAELNVHPNNLSQVINTFEEKSFYDYINVQRVEEFKRVLSLPESRKFTLLGLARDCGFNSKTSFNRNFRNATGLSPSEYLNQAHVLLEN